MLDNVYCEGVELHPLACQSGNYRNCGHHKDAGVRCALTGEAVNLS